MRNSMLLALSLSTLLLGGCDPEPVDASRMDLESRSTSILHEPLDLIVVLDVSYSMTRLQMAAARSLLDELLGYLDENDRFGLITVRKDADVVIELAPATPDAKAEWLATIRQLETGGLTNLEDGLELAKTLVSPDARVVFVGDGSPTWGSVDAGELVATAQALNLWTAGVGRHDEALLRRLGHYVDARDPGSLVAIFTPDATETRSPER